MDYDVAIVGSGFSAIALTINLLLKLPPKASIAVVGDDPGFGRGTAYRSEFHLHRLNVPAARMSVFPDQPDDFIEWLRRRGRMVEAGDFASRSDYGLYLRDTLASLLRSDGPRPRVDFVRSKASQCLHCIEEQVVFRLADDRLLRARQVILAIGTGNAGLPAPYDKVSQEMRRRIIGNPWRLGWLSRVRPEDDVCILGSGLTMIDQVLSLKAMGHRGHIHVLSRRGLVPHAHLRRPPQPVEPHLPESRDISVMLKALRMQVKKGADWRAVMDGLRPRTQALWQSLDRQQRLRFLRHALAWWNIHRHRLAPDVFDQFDAVRAEGRLTVHAGFLQCLSSADGRLVVEFRRRGSSETGTLTVDRLVNCTGMERAGIGHSPVLGAMADDGMVSTDELGLGIRVDAQSRVLDRDGSVQPGLYAVGALTAGQFWEITAVPDIRLQVQRVADAAASRFGALERGIQALRCTG